MHYVLAHGAINFLQNLKINIFKTIFCSVLSAAPSFDPTAYCSL